MSLQVRYTEDGENSSYAFKGRQAYTAVKMESSPELAQQQIDRLSRALDMFIYSASHDLRSPLTTMMGLINLAEISKDEGDRSGYFSMMRKSIEKLDVLIKEIVEITMNSKLGVAKEQINFRQLLKEKQEDLFHLKNVGKVKVRLELEKDSIAFYSDKNRLKLIIGNLLANAIQFADCRKDPPLVDMKVKVTADLSTITFSDNGIGIPAEHLPHIFDMFYRAHDYEVGPGLGLYIVKETVEVLKGAISVSSENMKGTQFVIELPNMR